MDQYFTPNSQPSVQPPVAPMPTQEKPMVKRPLWHWIVLYVLIGAVVIGLIYYFAVKGNFESIVGNQQQSTSPAISIVNMAFAPTATTVKKGTVVTWTNNDVELHKVTSDRSDGPKSPELKKGDSWSLPFPDAGTFTFHCSLHPTMKITVTVSDN